MYLAFYSSFSSFLLLQVFTSSCFWMFLLQYGSSMGYSFSSPLLQNSTYTGCQPLWMFSLQQVSPTGHSPFGSTSPLGGRASFQNASNNPSSSISSSTYPEASLSAPKQLSLPNIPENRHHMFLWLVGILTCERLLIPYSFTGHCEWHMIAHSLLPHRSPPQPPAI